MLILISGANRMAQAQIQLQPHQQQYGAPQQQFGAPQQQQQYSAPQQQQHGAPQQQIVQQHAAPPHQQHAGPKRPGDKTPPHIVRAPSPVRDVPLGTTTKYVH